MKQQKLFKWVVGRQSTNHLSDPDIIIPYHKLCLLSIKLGRWGFDTYIIRYPAYSYLPLHKDPIAGSHWRCNIRLWGKCNFGCQGKEILKLGEFLHIFRPDKCYHNLLVFSKTYKLSIGVAKFDRV